MVSHALINSGIGNHPNIVFIICAYIAYTNKIKLIEFLINYGYPDTLIPDLSSNLSGINAFDYTPYDSRKNWDEVFDEKNATKISFFFFSIDTIAKYGWDSVRANYKILKRNDYTLKDLQNSEYTVSYP